MTNSTRLVSTVLLVFGVGLVLVGFSKALGFTVGGILASVAAIAALLYAGAVWFGARSTSGVHASSTLVPLVVFDHDGRIVTGPTAGRSVTTLFPEMIRPDIQRYSTAALGGESARFSCLYNGRVILLDALPVRRADGTIVYGILLTGEPVPAAIAATV